MLPLANGGTLFSYNNKVKRVKFRLDWDCKHRLDYHYGYGKAGKIHRSLAPWKFVREIHFKGGYILKTMQKNITDNIKMLINSIFNLEEKIRIF